MAAENREKMEKTLVNLLEYQKQYNIKSQDLMIMMSLINLMSMIDLLNRDQPAAGAAFPNLNNLQAILGPLLALMMTSGRGSSGGGEDGKQAPFNPAMIFNLLSAMGGGQAGGGQSKEGQPKKTAQPVQREINLDLKERQGQERKPEVSVSKEGATKDSRPKENNPAEAGLPTEKKEQLPKPGEVLEWKFGVS